MVTVPHGLLREHMPSITARAGSGFSENPLAHREIELKAMAVVMAAEHELGNQPEGVSAHKIGCDIASHDLDIGHVCFIEVKRRIEGANAMMPARQEAITSLHEPEKFILAIVEVESGIACEPRYACGTLDTRGPPFKHSAIQFNMKNPLAQTEKPR